MLIDFRWLQFIFDHRDHQGARHLPQIRRATAG